MGMSTHVLFLRDVNDLIYQKYLKIFLACKESDIPPPLIVDNYFGGDGVDNNIEFPLKIECALHRWDNSKDSEGFEIDLNEIPEGVKTIRFYNSW